MSNRVTHADAGPAWSGADRDTLIEMIDKACRENPTKPALIYEDGIVVTRQELADHIERFAGYLASRIEVGDCVAIMLSNRVEFMISFFAVISAGGILVSINPTAREHDTGHILRDSKAVMVIAEGEGLEVIGAIRSSCPELREVVVVGDPEPDGLTGYYSDERRIPLGGSTLKRNDVATIYYTSGTTGAPKGCMLSHDWWMRVCDMHIRMTKLNDRDRTLCCMPFYYADPAFQLLCSLYTGGSMVVMRRFSLSRFWDVVIEHDVTELLLIASMPVLLLKADASPRDRQHKVRFAVSVSVPPDLHQDLVDRFGIPFIDNYGSTEATINTRVPMSHVDEMIGSGSIGVATPETELRVVDDDDEDVPDGTQGELLVRGPSLFTGYLNRPEATEEIMRGGWYHTGDLVRRDERGFFYFQGRKKDIIRRSGENIAASEVEDVLRTHPKIQDVAVIPVPDQIRGEEVKAYILPTEGNSLDTLGPDEIIEHCAERLAPFKVPRYLEYRDTDFPRTPSMRVQKEDLKKVPDLIAGSWDRESKAWR